MAEALILLVLEKIGAIVADEAIKSLYSEFEKEVSLLLEVERGIKQIAAEFRVIMAFLSQTETIERNDRIFEAWLQEVREVAHEVEDVLDEYAHITGELCSRSTHWFKRMFYKPKSIVSWHAIANQLKGIETSLQKISDMRSRYDIKFQSENSSNIVSKRQELTASSSYRIDQDELVGIEEESEKLIMWLKDDETVDRPTITVWGMGGLGKTSLVKSVLNSREVKEHFDCYMWISVSQKYEVDDILKKIIKDALVSMHGTPVDTESMVHPNLVQKARKTLDGKKYLIIFDDVWRRDVCIYFRDTFVDNCNGSKIVITTRIEEVAASCGGRYVLKLKSLCEEEAWDLFCRRAFKYEERRCPEAVEKWARKIVSKCQGLPLALVAIGSLMSDRAKTETEWRRFYDQFNWELNKNENAIELNWVKRALNLSYHYLPSYLKSCFLYCCIFPEDYLIKRKKLIRLWIAEGFISLEGRGRQTHEELAEVYLDELIQRCMLQVVERDSHGRVKACRIHDIVRELTITTSRELDFCVVVDDEEQIRKGDKVRRLSIHVCNNNILRGINSVSLRSFISFGTTLNSSLLSSFITGCKYLRVLDLEGMKIENLPDGVMDLFNLHHLGLRKSDINKLPESIGRLHNLQTLDLRSTAVEKLPHGVTELKNLRHLLVGGRGLRKKNRMVNHEGNFRIDIWGVKAPHGLAELKNLRTLKGVRGSKNLVRGVGNLTQLRSLHIFDVSNFVELCTSIAKMPFLSSLLIVSEGETFLSVGLDHPLQHLEKLSLQVEIAQGGLSRFFFCSLGNSLQKLHLALSMLREDPLPSLFHLSNLTSLGLDHLSYYGQQLWFRRGWFPHLTNLELIGLPMLEKVEIESDALQSLEDLYLARLNCLVSVPSGIEFLTTLKVLWLRSVRDELVERIKEADYSKISHIPTIHHVSRDLIHTNLSLLLKKSRG